ncbi:hypothetical protein F6V25_07865 [Oryzomonas japonica]|uniref:Uncharacterized protein n=1 Tax=Oryzomonas japonica TaxID=2603858 RepID=A0A7J4ZSD6_9BACT|nr:hypothetical protein [Oryzomonas japonica]KAB0665629.1 hypothetical protein F6V25_07865 [Oryzomonas japonica]
MPGLITIGDDLIKAIPDKRAALAACVKICGVPPKVIADQLGIDRSGLTKMIIDTPDPRHFPQEKENELMDLCRNEIPLTWVLLSRGYPSVSEIIAMRAEIIALRAEVERLSSDRPGLVNVFKFIGD